MAEKIVIESGPVGARESRWLGAALIYAVAAFAWLRFSDNVADNDLWGHVLYGQRAWLLGHVEQKDVLSWTAVGQPWINHEYWAEFVLGFVHRFGGGTGLWLLMLGMATVVVLWALREGSGHERGQSWVALILFAASVNFIALGYAVRPQLFTLLAFVVLLTLLRKFYAGRSGWGLLVPPLFAFWVNLHGGYLAGWLIVLLAGTAESFVLLKPSLAPGFRPGPLRLVTILALVFGATVSLAANPWGFQLVDWTARSILLPRPQITEWQPLGLTLANLPFYLVAIVSLVAWVTTREARRIWEAATLALLAVMSVMHQRHAPLFGLANLIFTPPHLLDASRRFAPHFQNLRAFFRNRLVRIVAALTLIAAGSFSLCLSVAPPREHPFTIEVPRDTYPVSAIEFMRQHELTGNTVTFFDWGQQVLWELPQNPVSFDGRLDTVFSKEIMEAHWRFYAGLAPASSLDLARAEVALLPVDSGGAKFLESIGWRRVYRDPLAVVIVKSSSRYPLISTQTEPVQGGVVAVSGREPFPNGISPLAGPRRNR